MTDPEILRYTQETGDFSRMLSSIPMPPGLVFSVSSLETT